MIGSWSDKYGRKPFLIIAFSTASLPLLVILLHLQFGLSMLFYFPAQVQTTNPCHACCKNTWAAIPSPCLASELYVLSLHHGVYGGFVCQTCGLGNSLVCL